jgi:tetratricopeptide (TPR) repeat protein
VAKLSRNISDSNTEWKVVTVVYEFINLFQSLFEIGNNFLQTGKLVDAIEIHERALNVAKRINNSKNQGMSLQRLIRCHQQNGDEVMAIKCCNQILELGNQAKDASVCDITVIIDFYKLQSIGLLNLGRIETDLNKFADAQTKMEQALALATQVLFLG